MYDEALRMPLLIRWPDKVRSGTTNEDLVLNLDFASTLLEVAKAKLPTGMQGRSFGSLLRGRTPDDWRTSMYYRYYFSHFQTEPHYGVRTKTHKLIHFPRLNQWELFDLAKDPHELRNLYTAPAYASVRKALTADLTRLRKKFGDNINDHGDKPRTGF
jgi:arylsulfatase A-like enzyme